MADGRINLTASASVTLGATGAGTATLGPNAGKAHWHVTGVIVQTTRPGEAPVPRVQVYLDQATPGNSQGLTYDGSFNQGGCDLEVVRGQNLIAAWAGGQSGDVATITVTGEAW